MLPAVCCRSVDGGMHTLSIKRVSGRLDRRGRSAAQLCRSTGGASHSGASGAGRSRCVLGSMCLGHVLQQRAWHPRLLEGGLSPCELTLLQLNLPA